MPHIYTNLGIDYDERVLPSITNEVLKAVVAQFDAGELITQREMLSARVRYDDDEFVMMKLMMLLLLMIMMMNLNLMMTIMMLGLT